MKILNLYAGIGGNRKLWEGHEITAVEHNQEIAKIYSEYFPGDNVIVADAHGYLLKNFNDFYFIWSSPPCQSHSMNNNFLHSQGVVRFPDFRLYEEIVFLKEYFKGLWIVENVKPYYEPLIRPKTVIDRHLFWSNFQITPFKGDLVNINAVSANDSVYGFSLKGRRLKHRKDAIIRSCVNPEVGLHILNCAIGVNKFNQGELFVA